MAPVNDDDLNSLSAALSGVTERLGHRHRHHSRVGSTNDEAMRWMTATGEATAPDGAVVTADEQSAGRGRLGRSWSSPPGEDLYVSVVSRPGEAVGGVGAVGLAVGVGLREGILAAVRTANDGDRLFDIDLKWPNDLMVEGRKLAGILCEARWQGRRADVVIGFGVNVRRDRFEDELVEIATSLAAVLDRRGGRLPGRVSLLAAILEHLEASLVRYYASGFAGIRSRYVPHCTVLGEDVVVPRAGRSPLRGRAVDLAEDGALLIETAPGRDPLRVDHGDVWLART